jgi:hypothetical protein
MNFGDLIKATFRGPSRGPSETVVGLCLIKKSLPVSAFNDPVVYIDVLTPSGIRHLHIMIWDFEVVRKLCNPSRIHDTMSPGGEGERKRR